MRNKIIAGNWKMNGNSESIQKLLQELRECLKPPAGVHCAVIPPSIYLPLVSNFLKDSPIEWGAQNVYPKNSGAFTGEISAPMLKDYHCRYVLVGHSERRTLFAESEKFIAEKFHHAKEHGIIPVLCVGETQKEREQGITEQVLANQLRSVAESHKDAFNNSIIAYEPVWAIGTGLSASPEQVQDVHQSIRALMTSLGQNHTDNIPVIYGGSVNEKNAQALFKMPDVDGGLIGGASLNAQQFVEIVQCIN